MPTPIIDGDSHFMEPFDLFELHIDPKFKDRCLKLSRDPGTGERGLVVDNEPMMLIDVEELLGALVAYSQKEEGKDLNSFDRYLIENSQWQLATSGGGPVIDDPRATTSVLEYREFLWAAALNLPPPPFVGDAAEARIRITAVSWAGGVPTPGSSHEFDILYY